MSDKINKIKNRLYAARTYRDLCDSRRNDPAGLTKARIDFGKNIVALLDNVWLSLGSIPTEYQLELLSYIIVAQKELERCTSDWAKRFKTTFEEMKNDLEFAIARPIMKRHLDGIGDCCKWKGSVNLDVMEGAEAVYYAMGAVHSKMGANRYALAALQKIDSAYGFLERNRFEGVSADELSHDQRRLFTVILGQMSTVERVVHLYYDKIVSYIGKDNEKKEVIEPMARLNEKVEFLLGYIKCVKDADVERYLIESKDYSRRMKVVVSRDGNGTRAEHYKLHGPFLGEFVDDECAIKEHFCGWEEFLGDEDGKLAEQNLRDVTVREVRLGKIVAKMEPVQEIVYKVIKK